MDFIKDNFQRFLQDFKSTSHWLLEVYISYLTEKCMFLNMPVKLNLENKPFSENEGKHWKVIAAGNISIKTSLPQLFYHFQDQYQFTTHIQVRLIDKPNENCKFLTHQLVWYTLFLYKQLFKTTPAWIWQKKIKQMLSNTLRLNFLLCENYSHSSATLLSRSKRIYSKKQANEQVCLYSWLIIMKMKMKN